MKTYKVLCGRPVGLGYESLSVGTFLANLRGFCQDHPQISDLLMGEATSSRILMNRNYFVKQAIENRCDFLLMIDPDMEPDMYVGDPRFPEAKGFLPTAFQHLMANPFGVVAAPATGSPPDRKVNVFVTSEDGKAKQITSEDAARRHANPCMEEVHAIGSGLILIHMPIINALEHPFFNDVYKDETCTELSVSQDIYFTQNCSLAGVPVWCNWYSWAGHLKPDLLGCPELKHGEKLQPHEGKVFGLPVTLAGTPA